MEYKVELTYFKASGKYYATGEYVSQKEHLFEIWEEIRTFKVMPGFHPGLVCYWEDGPISVNVPDHPHNHPHLIMPKKE